MRITRMNQVRSHVMNRWREPVHEWAVILAGGDGTRLRELTCEVSGDHRPKQFCAFFGGKSLLAHTRDRLKPLFLEDNTVFVLNREHRTHYRTDLSSVQSRRKLVQPSNRGTAPAIVLAVLKILRFDPKATSAIFPSDHHYNEDRVFRSTVDRGLRLAKIYRDQILIIGAPPTYPEVEYGWIQPGARVVDSPLTPLHYVLRFWEKPNLADAGALQKSGCLWNTFVTIGSGKAFLDLLVAGVPHVVASIQKALPESTLDCVYPEIQPADFSRHVLSLLPERLLVLCDGPSGWTDFGSPQRAMNVLHAMAAS
jgi:mannose-1-phosphate guanylyltransferase